LSHLTSVRQGHDESVNDFVRRFRETKNQCFSLTISEKDLAGLAFNGLHPYLREKLEGLDFSTLAQLHQKASAQESRSKDSKEVYGSSRHSVHLLPYDSSNDESGEVLTAEFAWPSKAKSYACDSLKPIHRNRQDEVKFAFDVAKCDRIFDELQKGGYIKLSHTLPPLDELKRRAYCKWHNSYSRATNDCNVFRRQI
jgi:hypothetical protein